MCKLLILTNSSKIKNQKKLINEALDLVTQTERSGCGYFGLTSSGLLGEKSTDSKMRYSLDSTIHSKPYLDQKYERFGSGKKFNGPLVFHGRTSTNEISLRNTHPILKHNWALSHNGVVTNIGPTYDRTTSNDTEHLIHYIANHNIKKLADSLTGYYAFAAISPAKKLYIVRDAIAPLYCAKINEIDSEIFATKDTHITELCKKMNWTHSIISQLNENTLVTYNSKGEYESHETFESLGYGQRESQFATKSLGYSLQDWTTLKTPPKKQLLPNEEYFLEYIASLRSTDGGTLYDKNDTKISAKEFDNLSTDDQLQCYLITPEQDEITTHSFRNLEAAKYGT